MTIDLPPQIERIVQDAILSGQYGSAEDVLTEAVAVWQARQKEQTQSADEQRHEAIERLKTSARGTVSRLAG